MYLVLQLNLRVCLSGQGSTMCADQLCGAGRALWARFAVCNPQCMAYSASWMRLLDPSRVLREHEGLGVVPA